ncbi:uncharacterized protein LOC116383392 [Anarrhichthys ocellatus]|uniref:uncharacterized protein LOC116383392 n=1 Tax=Anarrhichthys ocellatus TaxID=433405 RepID=UPI0012EEB94F|nr:uncharacterized protein LOC116383392 [Anarrhichthys ocellatus]
MVTQLDRQHGCIWTSEDGTDQCYPPPNLQALLKLVLVPHIDNMSVQALLMYFVLDMANFLQCKDDLLRSFCLAFTISSSFSQQIRAFWMLDHGHIKASMELLLSPRAAAPCLSWQHRCIIHCLLTRKQPQLALRYLHWTRPAIESIEDAKLCTDVLLQNSCVSEAWALLKRSHAESDNMVMYFLQTCNGFGLCAEALKCIPAGYNDGVIENGTTRSQLPLIKKDLSAGRPPCPLSAKLYQAYRDNTVSPEELVPLVRQAVIEVRKPHPKISEVVWPEHRARKSNSREMFLSTQALRHLTPSPSPMDRVEETERTPHADEPAEEKPVHNQPESPEHISSFRDLSSQSVSSITSASCLPLLRQDHPYVYERTLTLQRISSVLTDGENQSGEEEEVEEESTTPSSVDALTLDGATYPIFVSNLNKDIVVELVVSADKLACCKREEIAHDPPDVTDLRSSALSLNQEEQSDCIASHIFSFSLSCAPSETTQDLPTDLHQSPLSEDPAASSSTVSAGTGQQDISLLTTVCSSIFPTQLQISGSSLTPSLTCSIITTSAPSGTTNENSPKARLKMDEHCVESSSTLLDHCKMDRWWKQDLETCRASAGLLPATEPGATITSDNKRPSLVLGQPYSYSLVDFRDFTAKQEGDSRDDKQTDKEEPASCQGAIRSGRTPLRRGKRGKRA